MIHAFLISALDAGEESALGKRRFNQGKTAAFTGQEAGWDPEPFWTRCRREKFPTPDRPVRSLIAIPTEL